MRLTWTASKWRAPVTALLRDGSCQVIRCSWRAWRPCPRVHPRGKGGCGRKQGHSAQSFTTGRECSTRSIPWPSMATSGQPGHPPRLARCPLPFLPAEYKDTPAAIAKDTGPHHMCPWCKNIFASVVPGTRLGTGTPLNAGGVHQAIGRANSTGSAKLGTGGGGPGHGAGSTQIVKKVRRWPQPREAAAYCPARSDADSVRSPRGKIRLATPDTPLGMPRRQVGRDLDKRLLSVHPLAVPP